MMLERSIEEASAYRKQLQRGFRWLRFEGALEGQFREARQRENSAQLRVIALLVGLGALSWLIGDYILFGPGFSNPVIPVRTAITESLIAVLVASTFSSMRLQRLQTPAGLVLGFHLGIVALLANTLEGNRDGIADQVITYVSATYFIYFCFGLRFWLALPVALSLFAAYVGIMVVRDVGVEQGFYPAMLLGFPNIVGAFVCYSLEYAQRKSYLQARDLKYSADHDALTGLCNRRAVSEQLRRLWAHCIREKSAISIALIDIDYFKTFNDHYGHPKGDMCLTLVAELLRHTAKRPLDLAARYGGEEFIVLLPGCSPPQASRIMQDFQESLATLRIWHARSVIADRVTVSIGIAGMTPNANSLLPEQLIKYADEALYAAKEGGRNRIMLSRVDGERIPDHTSEMPQPLQACYSQHCPGRGL